ncbi:hypothetical protein ADK54_33240 [Streptomyces sp. WM6378]|nr:hypothetical protein ADK54_33240 [Streptomyces sp. WM6378]
MYVTEASDEALAKAESLPKAEAERSGFTGSPTILADGRDPFAEPGRAPGVACRVYRSADGLAGVPALDELRDALRTAAGG